MLDEAQCSYQLYPSRLPPPPPRMAALPIDEHGFPVPYFVGKSNGKFDFKVNDPEHTFNCVHEKRCWVCGQLLLKERVFVIEPICSILRLSSEPPSHSECAIWSARNCPFLSKPHTTRCLDESLDYSQNQLGGTICCNPGVVMVWHTKRFRLLQLPQGVLWKLGSPFQWEWFYQGRIATRDEVVHSIELALPIFEEEARRKGPEATRELKHFTRQHLRFLPAKQKKKRTMHLQSVWPLRPAADGSSTYDNSRVKQEPQE